MTTTHEPPAEPGPDPVTEDTTETPETPAAPPPGEGDTLREPAGGDREAARYRRRLREAETQRDALAGTLARLQSADVERLAGEHLAVPGDLFTFGTALADVLGEDGSVDAEKVTAATTALLAQRPGLAKPPPRHPVDTGGGYRGGTRSGAS